MTDLRRFFLALAAAAFSLAVLLAVVAMSADQRPDRNSPTGSTTRTQALG
jgi:hypothetical protein